MANETIPARPVDLDAERAAAHLRINAEAEQRRLAYITPGAGQALTYQRKVEEALRIKAARDADANFVPDSADYPMLSATVGIDGGDVVEVGTIVLMRNDQFSVIGAGIERSRAVANQAVDAAANLQGIVAAAQVTWPY